MPEPIVYLNGDFCKLPDAKVSILDRGLLFGDALYEVVRVHKGALFRIAEHYERIAHGLKAVRMASPFTRRQFEAIFDELRRRNRLKAGYIYIQVTRGVPPEREHRLPEKETPPTVFAYARAVAMPGWAKFPGGVSAVTVPDIRWQHCDIKTTMLLPNALAKQLAADAGAFEAIFVAHDGAVREGSSTSIFAVIDGVLRTHPANNLILPSITRSLVIEIAAEAKLRHKEVAFSRAEMLAAEEVFLASTTCDVCPIIRIDRKRIGKGVPGPVTTRLMKLFAAKLG
jgi:D-alanine transaminase